MASAKNDKLFQDRSDHAELAKVVRYVIAGDDDVARTSRVIVLPEDWQTDPWSAVAESEKPEKWDQRLPVVVLPEGPERLHEELGLWLRTHLQGRRNTVRFLIPRSGSTNTFRDRDLLILARAGMKAERNGAVRGLSTGGSERNFSKSCGTF